VHRDGLMGRLGMVKERLMKQRADELLHRIGARVPADALVGALTVAQQQEVEIAKALSTKAELIIMDEPTSALSSDEVEALFATVDGLRRQGVAIVFISHRLEEVLQIADRIVVLRDGKKVADLDKKETAMEQVIRLMVGRPLTDFFPKEEVEIREPILEVRGLSRGKAVKEVSFQLHQGEILGFAGLVGAGRTETARPLFGADPKTSGEILIDGQPVDIRTPWDAVRLGIGFVPEDRKLQGLVLKLAVRENVALAGLPIFCSRTIINLAKLREVVDSFIKRLRILTPSTARKVMSLSGGNQQKVVLAKWLALQPKILILDEPTRGIDVGAKAEIHAIMSDLAKQGVGIIMISSEMPEILGMSDRIVVMAEGRVTAILDRAEATQEEIMAYATLGQKERAA
ncbi:MAG: sugar ABC transporter ATP-binding protein, partial [Anaerolineae bacterium]